MKKAGLIPFIIITVSAFAVGEGADTVADSVPRINIFEHIQTTMDEYYIPAVPAIFVGKVGSNWIGIGFLFSNPEHFNEDTTMYWLMKNLPLFQFALLLKGTKSRVSFFFNYYRREDYEENGTWSISASFSY